MKKRILIISYHFPPLAVAASQRAWAFAQKLSKQGHGVEVLTHDFSDDPNLPLEGKFYGVEEANIKVHRVPFDRHTSVWAGIPLIRKAYVLTRWTKGYFDLDGAGKFSYRPMKAFLRKYLANEKFDLLLGIYSPHSHLRLCHEMHEEFDTPYVLDFRDLWSINANRPNYHPMGIESIRSNWIKRYWGKWTRNAVFLSTISNPMGNFLAASFHKKAITITNGFHPEETAEVGKPPRNGFEILYTGRLYPEQDINPFLEGLRLWIDSGKRPDNLALSFIGLDNEAQKRVKALCHSHGLADFLNLLDNQPREGILTRQANAAVLYYPGWPKRPGVYSSKLFEYLATGRPILQSPNDHNVIEDLLTRSKSGLSSDSPKEIEGFLEREWLKLDQLTEATQVSGIMNEAVLFHSWENQVSLLSEAIERTLK